MDKTWRSALGETWEQAVARFTRQSASRESGVWWISFADESKFLGLVITRAPSAAEAIRKTHELGLNPGGSASFQELSKADVETIKPDEFDIRIKSRRRAMMIARRSRSLARAN